MATIQRPVHVDVERRTSRSSAIVTAPARGVLAVLTWILAIVGAWSLCLAVATAGLAAIGVGGFGLPVAAAGVGLVASLAIVGAEMLASHPSRR